jgi:hypothetical protein
MSDFSSVMSSQPKFRRYFGDKRKYIGRAVNESRQIELKLKQAELNQIRTKIESS